MGCGSSTESSGPGASRPKAPWEIETDEVRKLCGKETDPHKVALICQRAGRKFVDLTFPPCAASAGKGFEESRWARPVAATDGKNPVLFDNDIKPNDVCQGRLGDCWLICVFAILAKYPVMIRRICPVQFSDIDAGVFRLRLCHDGWWEWVVVDSYLPVKEDMKSADFGRCRAANEYWVSIFEKAYARLYGSYESIVIGFPAAALEDLTGCSSYTLDCGKVPVEQVFKELDVAFGMFYLVTAVTRGVDTSSYVNGQPSAEDARYAEQCMTVGIVAGHAYSVLRVVNYKGTLLAQLRNPWGSGEWNGAWSDGSTQWTPEAIETIRPGTADQNDGAFWMPLVEFVQFFNTVCVTKFRMDGTLDDWSDFRLRGTIAFGRPNHLARVTVRHDTPIEVTIHNQAYRRLTAEQTKTQTALRARVYETTDGNAFTLVPEDPAKRHFQLKASSHPYLVIPYQSDLKAEHNGQKFTIVVHSRERTTKVDPIELSGPAHAAAVTGADFPMVHAQVGLQNGALASVPVQCNGISPPTTDWAQPKLVRCPGEGECCACMGACLFPCCMSAAQRTTYDGSNCCLNTMCLTVPLLRNIVRSGYSIEGSCGSDIAASVLCYSCVIMQVRRELRCASRKTQVAHMAASTPKQSFVTSCCDVDHCCSRECCFSCCCPPCSNAYTRSQYDGSGCCFNCCCVHGPMTRNIIREGYHLSGNCCGDLLCSLLFPPCAANQLRQEVAVRGPKSQQDVVQLMIEDGPPNGPAAPNAAPTMA